MAAAFLSSGAGARALEVESAGLLPGGRSPPPEVIEAMDAYGLDLRGHRSRQLTAALVGPADLVVGMGRRHVQEAVLLDVAVWPRAFTLKELVRRGEAVGPRADGITLSTWVESVHAGRVRADLAGRDRADEVEDPFGGPPEGYRQTAGELGQLVGRLEALVRPPARGARRPPAAVPELEDPATGWR